MKYSYTLIKSNRKSFSIRITDDNKIIVRAPEKATQKDIDRLLKNKEDWINKVLSFNKSNRLDSEEVRIYKTAYVNGTPVPVIIDTKNMIDKAGVHVKNTACFKEAYVNGIADEFVARFREAERKCGLHSNSVNFRSYKSRWGCCDGDNNIVFNFKLMMLPLSLQYYVTVHELCHTIYHNHSSQFWTLVRKYLPDCMNLRKQLKNYNFIVNMY